MNDPTPGMVFLAIFLGIVALVIIDERQWHTFVARHHCVVTAKSDAQYAQSLTTNGAMATTVIPGTTTWKCDDGISYTR